ncbi:hypothetical protein BH10ACI2_BH10ACI2_17860 [soil metagenome]
MSDIGLDLSGIVALLLFLAIAAGLGICGLVSGIVALSRGKGARSGVVSQRAFGYFAAAGALGLINLILFGILLAFVDSISKEFNEILDKAALFVWLPLQPVVWIVSAIIFNKKRKTATPVNDGK